MNELTIEDLLLKIKEYNVGAIEQVKKAYNYAEVHHLGQLRQSGEPYIVHPLNVAYILAEQHADTDTLCAGLLHDCIEDSDEVTKEVIAKEFNDDVATLVDGVTKISRMNFSSKKFQNMANTRKIITSIMVDVRIILIKLADRLHNMRTLQFKKVEKQRENALETIEIFVPLAYYIGNYRIKSELEDLSLIYLKPEEYKKVEEIKENIEEKNKGVLDEMLYTIKSILDDKNIPYEIKVRTKNIYGIYKKLYKEKKKLSDIHDLLALKIMVDEIANCYLTLGIIHSKYHPQNERFKDYICNPKTNMYQSLHTTVFGENGRLVQTQIRTFDMDKVASFGLATYWDINIDKARDKMQKDLREKFQFYKSLRQIDKMFVDNEEFVKQVKEELFSKKVYVYTPTGETVELPVGSTPIDFAYKLHTAIGNTMVGAVVNEKRVSSKYTLQDKDRVKILTDPLAVGPTEDWLEQVHTAKAKRKINAYIK